MQIHCSRSNDDRCVEISATTGEFLAMAHALRNLMGKVEFESTTDVSTPYPETLRILLFSQVENVESGRFALNVLHDRVEILVDSEGAALLAESFSEFHEESCESGFHWHIDHWDGSGNLAPTEYSLIFFVK